jgi:hypothetical protein
MKSLMSMSAFTMTALALAAATGCVSGIPQVARSDTPSLESGYIGALSTKDTVVGFGFGVCDAMGHDHVFSLGDGVRLIEVPQGLYHVCYWVTWAALGGQTLTKQAISVSDAVGVPFDVKPGQVMLLGQWFADREMGFGSNTFTLKSSRISKADAAAVFLEAYHGFAGAPVNCLVCTP